MRDQHAAKLDVVVPVSGIRSSAGQWLIDGAGPAVLGPDGVTTTPGRFVPTVTCDAAMADKLDPELADQLLARAETAGAAAASPGRAPGKPRVRRRGVGC